MEELLFTVMMCTAMFAMMISYNQVMASGTIEALTFRSWLKEALVIGPIILLLEFAIIAPVAHSIAFRIIHNYTHEHVPVPVVISIVTVCLVCPVASAVATLLVRHVTVNFVPVWLAALRMNFLVALCWQLLVAGPLVRYSFGKAKETLINSSVR